MCCMGWFVVMNSQGLFLHLPPTSHTPTIQVTAKVSPKMASLRPVGVRWLFPVPPSTQDVDHGGECLSLSFMGRVCFTHCLMHGLWYLSTVWYHCGAVARVWANVLWRIDGFPAQLYPSRSFLPDNIWVLNSLYPLLAH